MGEPTGLKATKGIELLTFSKTQFTFALCQSKFARFDFSVTLPDNSADTPNGFKASILLEELKEAYGLEYTWQSININKDTQKEPWYTALCPNGRIPCIVDHDRGGFPVFEGLAILGYLTRHYDTEKRFSFDINDDQYTICEEWMAWQHGGVGPM
jgi:glutathione S-transferase